MGTYESKVRPSPSPASTARVRELHAGSAHRLAERGTRGPGVPLPHLAAIQRSFGKHDVSTLAAHTDAGAARASRAMGAEAFTVGEHVAFMDAAPSLHTAAHEAAHAVQQRRGVHLAGGVGRVSDRHERHADAVADRVVAGQSSEALLGASAGAGARAGSASAVQAKMGFEFETDNGVQRRDRNGVWVGRGRSSKPIYEKDGFKIHTDTHQNPEFVFDAQDDLRLLESAADKANELCESLSEQATETEDPREQGLGPEWGGISTANVATVRRGDGWQGNFKIWIRDFQWTADAQMTMGVPLDEIPRYLDNTLSDEDVPKHREHVKSLDGGQLDGAVRGLLELVIHFVYGFRKWKAVDAEEGPKTALAFMHRNSFDKMYKSMNDKQQKQFADLFFEDGGEWRTDNPVTMAIAAVGADTPVIQTSYPGEPRGAKKATLRQWIDSIIGKGEAKDKEETDLMSPPAGWREGHYSMGKLDMDKTSIPKKSLALFEYRATANREKEKSGRRLPVEEWKVWIQAQFQKADAWSGTLTRASSTADAVPARGGAEVKDVTKASRRNKSIKSNSNVPSSVASAEVKQDVSKAPDPDESTVARYKKLGDSGGLKSLLARQSTAWVESKVFCDYLVEVLKGLMRSDSTAGTIVAMVKDVRGPNRKVIIEVIKGVAGRLDEAPRAALLDQIGAIK